MASRLGIFDLSDLKFSMKPPDVPTARVLRWATKLKILKIEPTLTCSPRILPATMSGELQIISGLTVLRSLIIPRSNDDNTNTTKIPSPEQKILNEISVKLRNL